MVTQLEEKYGFSIQYLYGLSNIKLNKYEFPIRLFMRNYIYCIMYNHLRIWKR